jgi:uncharacterized protein (UPF0248 family)
MAYLRDLLNDIKQDATEHPADYTFAYEDRVLRQLIEKKYADIKRIEASSVVIDMAGEEIALPLTRIKLLKKGKEILWQRSTGNNSD